VRCSIAGSFGTAATFLKYAEVDGVIPASPADTVARSVVPWEEQRRPFLHPPEFAARFLAWATLGTGHARSDA
jgi:hypothetical protein